MSNEAKKVQASHIQKMLDEAETQEHIFWGKELVISYKLANGFTVSGRGACVDPANFDAEIGRKIARKQAEDQLWLLEGYLLQNKLYDSKKYVKAVIMDDDSGHEYCVPVSKIKDFEEWMESEAAELGDEPYFAERIEGDFTFYIRLEED